jgi:hypothetical protein
MGCLAALTVLLAACGSGDDGNPLEEIQGALEAIDWDLECRTSGNGDGLTDAEGGVGDFASCQGEDLEDGLVTMTDHGSEDALEEALAALTCQDDDPSQFIGHDGVLIIATESLAETGGDRDRVGALAEELGEDLYVPCE